MTGNHITVKQMVGSVVHIYRTAQCDKICAYVIKSQERIDFDYNIHILPLAVYVDPHHCAHVCI